jgi:hypothetical protein
MDILKDVLSLAALVLGLLLVFKARSWGVSVMPGG